MSNEREPLLSDATIADRFMYGPLLQDVEQAFVSGAKYARQFYEDLITSGNLRVVQEVGVNEGNDCHLCGWDDNGHWNNYCGGCGNPIKRP